MGRESFNRMISSQPINRPETKEFPKPPAILKSQTSPAKAKAFDDWHRQIDDWRKSFAEGVTTTVLANFQRNLVLTLQPKTTALESSANSGNQAAAQEIALLKEFIVRSAKGAAGRQKGLASLDENGHVPVSQLPDMLSLADFDRILTNGKEPLVDPFGNVILYTY